ncbi:GTPase ObgE [bacterium]|nr:GTPase ObgE [bacterium]|tara:strand:- start:1756 stop:2748 length:993 start_codon:yes stop_codon:yes gene_type:complete
MIIDDVKINVSAGHGGKGSVAFQKTKQALGPTGGSGGNGGSVIFRGVSDLTALNQFRNKIDRVAENGRDGRPQFRDGNTGKDLVLNVPVGTVIHNLNTDDKQEIIKVDEHIVIARGGNGGKGNFLFRSSRNTTPKQFQPGLPGEGARVRLELKFIADVGLIGYPNVGKSSLLNELTNANSKVANYHFTTLEPNLGVYYGLILADIPGLIEGASKGKGLGIKFLRHIERTKVLFHLVSAESQDLAKDYRSIRKELSAHNKEILKKPEYVFLSKSDILTKEEIKEKISSLEKISNQKNSRIKSVMSLTIYDDKDLKRIEKILNLLKREKGLD